MIGRGRDLSAPRDVIELEVRSAEPQRLDHFVLLNLNWRSRTRIQGLIHEGRILVNGEESKPSRKVRTGDQVTVHLTAGTGVPRDYAALDLEVLYEDDHLLAVNKPPGLLVHPVGRHVYDTLLNYLHHRYRDVPGENGEPVRPRLCHRIDRDTTGLVVLGKEAEAHRDVQGQFERRQVSKEYLALVVGSYPRDEDTVEIPIGEGRTLETCLEHQVLKASRTSVRVLKRYREHTLLQCLPHTGRQNQIRVHLASQGYPIAGDTQYGAPRPPADLPQRYLLHSSRLRFYHPREKLWIDLRAPLPTDFRNLIDSLA